VIKITLLMLLFPFALAHAAVLDVVNESKKTYSINCTMPHDGAVSNVVHSDAEMTFTAPGVWTCHFGRYANTSSSGKDNYNEQFFMQFNIDSVGNYVDSPLLSGPHTSNGELCFSPPSKSKIYLEPGKLTKTIMLNWKSTKVYGPLKGQRIASGLAKQMRRAFDNSSYRYTGRFDPESNTISVIMKTSLCGE
jgi:hypothetical protein